MNLPPELDQARKIMTEAKQWSVMKWLSEKKRVRKVADAANLALDTLEESLRANWDPQLAAAYKELKSGPSPKNATNPETVRLANSIRRAHDAALGMRMEAEAIFDKAEKRLSTAMAREGCDKALDGWEAHEEAIRLSEKGVVSRQNSGTSTSA